MGLNSHLIYIRFVRFHLKNNREQSYDFTDVGEVIGVGISDRTIKYYNYNL
jgi:hypothetical protein